MKTLYDFTHEEAMSTMNEILAGVKVENYKGKIYLIRYPTAFERIVSDGVYNNAVLEAKKLDLMSEKDMWELMERDGLWTKEDDEELDYLAGRINSSRKIKTKMTFYEQRKEIDEKIDKLLSEYYAQLNKKYAYHSNCCEGYASNYRMYYYLSRCIIDEDEKRIWDTMGNVLEDTNTSFVMFMRDNFTKFNDGPTHEMLRYIVKQNEFRSLWSIAKNVGKIFSENVADWSRSQVELAKWAIMYDNINQDYERPPSDMLDNDAIVDEWIEKRHKEIEAKLYEKFKGIKLAAHGDVILVAPVSYTHLTLPTIYSV